MFMQYALNRGLCYRQIDQEFLVYSNYSRETLVIHKLAFDLLILLETGKLDFAAILSVLSKNNSDLPVNELQPFLDSTLRQFCQLGLLDCS